MLLSDLYRLHPQLSEPHSAELWHAMQALRSCVSFMNTGAHPDDETTPMLTALALREGVKISHACANRGEGGQNVIGHETGANLGAIRTREMERAAAIIPMTHYWLSQSPSDSINDFGFSKSGDETLDKWGEARTLQRFVEIIRRERPDIICPTFLDIPGQHGHHQAMTRSAFKAVKMAANVNVLDGHGLNVWQVKKIYLPAWSGAGNAYDDDLPPPPETIMIDASGADPVLGADYAQIAQYSRSFHRSQGMGKIIEAGIASTWPLHLAWSYTGATGVEDSIFAGLPKALADLAEFANAPGLSDHLSKAQAAIDAALQAWPEHVQIREHAARAYGLLTQSLQECPSKAAPEIVHRISAKLRQLAKVVLLAHQDQPRVSLSQTNVRPGEAFTLKVQGQLPKLKVNVVIPVGWNLQSNGANEFTIHTSETAHPSSPYPDIWHPDQANGEVYVSLDWIENDTPMQTSISTKERLIILPERSADLQPNAAILNLQSPKDIHVEVSEIHPKTAPVRFEDNQGWQITPRDTGFDLSLEGAIATGLYIFDLTLEGHGALSSHASTHSHTGTTQVFTPTSLAVQVMDVALPNGRIAYIGGGNDNIDHWLRALGVDVESISATDLADIDLTGFDTILIGVFAFRNCPTLEGRLKDLHKWVHEGGNLVTMYHRPWDNWDVEKTPLAPLTIGKPSLRWRITDENAKVRHLAPDHPLLCNPNRINSADWDGWKKERGLYFAAQWDPAYTPLLEMADPGEAPLQGALLSGQFGAGRHTHTSLILQHQLQNLVPGAYRLLANLLHTQSP